MRDSARIDRNLLGILFQLKRFFIISMFIGDDFSMNQKDFKVGIFSFPLTKSNATPSKNLVSILSSITSQTYLLTSSDYLVHANGFPQVCTYGIDYASESNSIKKIFKYFHRELRLAIQVNALNKNINTWFFFFGGDKFILPMLVAKLLKKKSY